MREAEVQRDREREREREIIAMAPVPRSFDLHKLRCSTRSGDTSASDNLN